MSSDPRLTTLAHGGGCGCKLAPRVLREILAETPIGAAVPELLVGTETGDDAAVYRLNERQALVATTDFFTPIVDDAFDFGRIAATNALSDVYAMGGVPILALALVGMPLDKLPAETVRRILAGGAAVCERAGIPVAGGHSIDSPEPIYGLVALGLADPGRIMRNSGGRAGDALILTKGLGVGIFSAALKRGELGAAEYATMIASTTQLNSVGKDVAGMEGVHSVTDVTGFGLLGYALEMCRGAGLAARLVLDAVPLLPGAEALVRAGVGTGAASRNWASYGEDVRLPEGAEPFARGLLCDPQTSGGLLIAVAPEAAEGVLQHCRGAGFAAAAIVGWLESGAAEVLVV